jgi:Tol biopolymer transport system component
MNQTTPQILTSSRLSWFRGWVCNGLGWISSFCLLVGLSACRHSELPVGMPSLNSRYTDHQPALSGSGQYVAFVTNRAGSHDLVLYDLRRQQFVELPRLNHWDAIAENPSISNNARYIVYLASDRARPDVELYDRITQQIQILTSGYRGWVRNPSISPEGRYIAFESSSHGQWDIEVIDRGSNIELDLLDERR